MRKIIDMPTVIAFVTGYILAEILIRLISWAMSPWMGFMALLAIFLTLVGYWIYDYKRRSKRIDTKFDKAIDELTLELNEKKEHLKLQFETRREDLDDYR